MPAADLGRWKDRKNEDVNHRYTVLKALGRCRWRRPTAAAGRSHPAEAGEAFAGLAIELAEIWAG